MIIKMNENGIRVCEDDHSTFTRTLLLQPRDGDYLPHSPSETLAATTVNRSSLRLTLSLSVRLSARFGLIQTKSQRTETGSNKKRKVLE